MDEADLLSGLQDLNSGSGSGRSAALLACMHRESARRGPFEIKYKIFFQGKKKRNLETTQTRESGSSSSSSIKFLPQSAHLTHNIFFFLLLLLLLLFKCVCTVE